MPYIKHTDVSLSGFISGFVGFVLFCFVLKTRPHCAAQADLKLLILLSVGITGMHNYIQLK
jgi:hypothetical protein